MIHPVRTLVFVAALSFAVRLAHAQVAPVAHDTQVWVQAVAVLPVGDQWLVHAEVQPRWNDEVSRRDQLILRSAVGRRVGRHTTVWAGHAYIPRWQTDGGVAHEQRAWQQVSITLPTKARWTPSLRFRPEQRFADAWGDASHRFRAMGRVVRPLGASAWSLAASNEYLVTLDDTLGGPRQGFDQNRVFGGLMRRFSPASTVEAGYLWQLQPQTTSAPRRHNHTLFVWFNYAPPAR